MVRICGGDGGDSHRPHRRRCTATVTADARTELDRTRSFINGSGSSRHPGPDPTPRPTEPQEGTAERGLLDFVTVEDALGSRNHALRVAALVARSTSRIGLIPTLTATDPAPSTLASALAALDHDPLGRAGWRLRTPVDDVRLPGDRRLGTPTERARYAERLDDAAVAVAAVRLSWRPIRISTRRERPTASPWCLAQRTTCARQT